MDYDVNFKKKFMNIFYWRRFCNDFVLIVFIYYRMWKLNICISKYCMFYMLIYLYDWKLCDEVRILIEKFKYFVK